MSEAQKIRDKADTDILALQANCSHAEESDWMDQEWAIGHSTGYMVRICQRCELVRHRRTLCMGGWPEKKQCAKTITDSEIFKGDGRHLSYGSAYCKDCYDEGMKKALEA